MPFRFRLAFIHYCFPLFPYMMILFDPLSFSMTIDSNSAGKMGAFLNGY
jgi:hypothetical protein